MRIGIIGVGHLAASLLRGCLRAGWAAQDILLSPRGQGPDLAERHGFALANDSAEIVQRCKVVLLAVRPGDAAYAVAGLPWGVDQTLISACAGVPIKTLSAVADPVKIVRIMPLTASELGASPTLVYPHVPAVDPLLAAIGTTLPLQTEDQFEAGTVSAAIYGWAQALIRDGVIWSEEAGLDPDTARALVSRTFVAAGRMMAETDAPMVDILTGLTTPGGITEAGLIHLEGAQVPEAWRGACEVVLHRLRGGT
ncbi:pyrroline-5-carboxylate reductase dimerization domain-containing protein [Aestuariivita sp.]|jgi:pyrroline-5-carboxylate reductase|uniref:pyrroline-5-carboxylate reductase family protein n=1 Tax=Aestuariivita sp. TaxID=1872407 RepID=UPI0021730A66|nr:pyrroline-5-carboxylate reductase dimerization domain-containing protein [Aestuariivita sp.]MCE8007695.1 NAD(P)-binding domain-containing protein [Aestuariivita sp.]